MAPAPVVQQPEHGKARRTAEVIGAERVLPGGPTLSFLHYLFEAAPPHRLRSGQALAFLARVGIQRNPITPPAHPSISIGPAVVR